MHGRLLAILTPVALALVLGAGGCVRSYREPSLSEPHAVAKIRVIYHGGPNTMLTEDFRLNNRELPWPSERGHLDVAQTEAVRVRAEPSLWSFGSTFWHGVTLTELRPETIVEEYPCGSQTIGASTQTTYCTRYHTEYRTMTINDTVIDSRCLAQLRQFPQNGAFYVIQYDVYGGDRCTVRCYEQHPRPSGGFDLTTCR